MNQRIIYPLDNGGVAVVIPAPNCGLTVEEIARKDVPDGVPFRIIDVSDIPADSMFRNAWEADFSVSDGCGVGHDKWFAEQAAKEKA